MRIFMNGMGQSAEEPPQYNEKARRIEAFLPKSGTPKRVFTGYSENWVDKYTETPDFKEEQYKSPSFTIKDTFEEGPRVTVNPDGSLKVGGKTRERTEGDIGFKKVSTGIYSRKQDSTFRTETEPIKDTFAIMPDIRPDGYFFSEETMVDGMGASLLPSTSALTAQAKAAGMAQKSGADKFAEFIKALPIEQAASAYTAVRGARRPAAPAPASAPAPVYYAPEIQAPSPGPSATTIAIIAGAGILALGGIFYLAIRRT